MGRVVITGANGFIGRYVTDGFLYAGYSVFAIDCCSHGWQSDSVEQIITKISSGASVKDCIEKIKSADVIVHLAADITVPGDAMTVGNNIDGMFAALEIARQTNVKQFILLSSIPVIGETQYTPIDELHPILPKTPYHWSKYLCEQMLDKYHDVFHSSAVIRIPSPVGLGMRNNVFLSILINRMLKNEDVEIYGAGSRIQSYIDVRDISIAIIKAIESESNGLFLIAGKKAISNMQLAELCKNILKSKSKILTNIHEDLNESERWIISYKKAEKTFGYQPSLDIEDTIRWIVG